MYIYVFAYNIICTEPRKTKPILFIEKKNTIHSRCYKHHIILTLKTRLKTLDNKSTFNIYINITVSIFRYNNILITLKDPCKNRYY